MEVAAVAMTPSLFSTKHKQRVNVNVLPSAALYSVNSSTTGRKSLLRPETLSAASGQGLQGQSQGHYEAVAQKRSLLQLAAASNTLPSSSARSLPPVASHQRHVSNNELSPCLASSERDLERRRRSPPPLNFDSTIVEALTDSLPLSAPPTAPSSQSPSTVTIDRSSRFTAADIDRPSQTAPIIDRQVSIIDTALSTSDRSQLAPPPSILNLDEHRAEVHMKDNRFPCHDLAAKHKYKITLHYPELQASVANGAGEDADKLTASAASQLQHQQQHHVTVESIATLPNTKKSSLVNHHHAVNANLVTDDSRLLTADLHIHGDNVAGLNSPVKAATSASGSAPSTSPSGKKSKTVRFAETVLDVSREGRSLSQQGASLHHQQLELHLQQPQRRWSSPLMTSWARRGVAVGGTLGSGNGGGGGGVQQLVPAVPSTRTQMPAVAERYIVRASPALPRLHHDNSSSSSSGADLICLLRNRYSHLPATAGEQLQQQRPYVSSSSSSSNRQDVLDAANGVLLSTSLATPGGGSSSRRWHQRDVGRELRADVIFNFGRIRFKRPGDTTSLSATSDV